MVFGGVKNTQAIPLRALRVFSARHGGMMAFLHYVQK